MTAPKDEFARYCVELLGSLGGARSRRMFGGHGIYVDDLFVALIIGERLYLKADGESRAQFEAAGCQPFIYDGKDKPVTVSYYSAPDEAMESRELMQPWARLAVEAALRARTTKDKTKIKRPAAAKKASAARPAKRAAR
jgi:DNA transformation protein